MRNQLSNSNTIFHLSDLTSGISPLCKSPRSNLNQAFFDHLDRDRIQVVHVILRRGMACGVDIHEYHRRYGPIWNRIRLRQHAKSGINPLQAAADVTVVQLSDAYDEAWDERVENDISKRIKEEYRCIVCCSPVLVEDTCDLVKHVAWVRGKHHR